MTSTLHRHQRPVPNAASKKLRAKMKQRQKQKADRHKITINHALSEFSNFAAEFSEFADGKEVKLSAAACTGIGPVQYKFTILARHGCYPNKVNKMNIVVKDMQETGDAILKLLATSTLVAYGSEAPIPWLPSLQRAATRAVIRERAEMLVEREEIAVPWSPGDLQILTLEFIREFWDDVSHTPNERELEVIAYNMHPMYEDSDDNERSAEQILDTFKLRFQKLIPIEVLKAVKVSSNQATHLHRECSPLKQEEREHEAIEEFTTNGTLRSCVEATILSQGTEKESERSTASTCCKNS